MIMAKDSNGNYVKVEDIKQQNNNIEYIYTQNRDLLYSKYNEVSGVFPLNFRSKSNNNSTLKNYRIYGNTISGESVGDRTVNLFDKNHPNVSVGAFTANGFQLGWTNDAFIYIECEPDTTYTVSKGLQPTSGTNRIAVCTTTEIPNSNSNVYDYKSLQAGMPYTEITITTGSNAAYLCAFIYHKDEEMPINEMLETIQIEKGSSASSYEPYGYYRVPVKMKGKNLFDKSNANIIRGYFNGSQLNTNATTNRTIYIPCLPDTVYTITKSVQSPTQNNRFRLCTTTEIPNDNTTVNDYVSLPDGNTGTKLSITTNSNAAYLCCFIYYNTNNDAESDFENFLNSVQIEYGSSSSSYEPYHLPVTTNLYLPEQIKMVGDESEYIDFKEQKQYRVRKNLLKNTATSQTINGVTFTVNDDGSVTCSGILTSGEYADLVISGVFLGDTDILENGNYVVSCTNGSNNASLLVGNSEGEAGQAKAVEINISTNLTWAILRIRQANPAITLYPMIRKANIEDDTYEPYIENTELNVALPALPILSGTNTLSVGTEAQPSKVEIKGKVKGIVYGWHVDPDISDSSNAITYLEDAIGMAPAAMGSTTFNYGSWENAFFMPKPCMLKSNGKVDYYLDPNDYTKKLDGTTSDVANPNYDGNAMMEWPKIWYKYVKGVKEGQGYFYVANYKADGNFHCWCNYDSEDNEIDHFYTAIYNGTSFANYDPSKTYVINDFVVYDNKLYKSNTDIATAESFDSTKWDLVSNTAPVIDKMRSLSDVRLTNNNGNGQTSTTTETTRAEANNTTSAAEWYIETYSDRLLINGLLVLMGKSLNTQAVFGRGLVAGGQSAKEAYVTGTLNDKGLFWGVAKNNNSGVKAFGMENFWGCCWHRTAGLITNNHAIKLKLTYGTKDGSNTMGYNQTGNGYIDNGIAPYSSEYVQKMSYNKYGFIPAIVTGGSQSTYYADFHYQNTDQTGITCALFGGNSAAGMGAGAFYLNLYKVPGSKDWSTAASLSCKPQF